jgi:hypothetical protein
MRLHYILLILFVVSIITTLMVIDFAPETESSLVCRKYDQFKKTEWSGKLVKKFIDPANDHRQTIELVPRKAVDLFRSSDEFYGFLQEGDYISKEYKSDIIQVDRNGAVFRFKIDFGCKKLD